MTSPAGDRPVAELDRVRVTFGDQTALDDVDLVVPHGTIVGLIGPSGCGKTTLIRTMTGAVRPSDGSVRVFGVDPGDFGPAERRRFAYMPQQPVLFPQLTVWGNLTFVASMYGTALRGRRRRLTRLLELVDLEHDGGKRFADCSGGMQRRLSLAATLTHDPELLFLDEPTAGIDPILRERFWEHFRALRDRGNTLIVSTQYVGEAVACDLVAIISAGRLLAVQPPDRLADLAYDGVPLSVGLGGGWLSGTALGEIARDVPAREVARTDDGVLVVVADATSGEQALRDWFARRGIGVTHVERFHPTHDEMFVRIIERHRRGDEQPAVTG